MTGDWLPVNDSVEFSKFFSPPAEPGVYLKEITYFLYAMRSAIFRVGDDSYFLIISEEYRCL
jgi:hypothetical protein